MDTATVKSSLMASKQQEREALAAIKALVDALGPDSYLSFAFEGVFDIAESNIENDFGCSLKKRVEAEEHKNEALRKDKLDLEKEIKSLKSELSRTRAQLDRELKWHHYDDDVISDYDYERLLHSCDYTEWNSSSGETPEDYISFKFGFKKEEIKIIREKAVNEINKHLQIRSTGKVKDRKPLYYSTDWNWCAFEVCGTIFYLLNGDLRMK